MIIIATLLPGIIYDRQNESNYIFFALACYVMSKKYESKRPFYYIYHFMSEMFYFENVQLIQSAHEHRYMRLIRKNILL